MSNKQPIIILDEHPFWLEALYQEFSGRNISYKRMDISSSAYDATSDIKYPFFVNRLSPSAENRNHSSAFSFTLNYILYLESLGKRVINGSSAVILETNKAFQLSLLRSWGIPQPKSVIVNSLSGILKNIDTLTFPVVIKPNLGGSGVGIQKFTSKRSLADAIGEKSLIMPSDNLLILQEFIQPKENNIIRVETINGKVIYAMKVFTPGTFNLCPSDSCDIERGETKNEIGYCVANPGDSVRFELFRDIPSEIVKAIEKTVQKAGLECGGVEYLVDQKGDWFVYDINALSILRSSFKQEYGIDGWGMLADFFIEEYKKVLKGGE